MLLISLCLAPSAPRNPQIINTNRTSLKLQWIEPDILNGIILHYRVSIAMLVSKRLNQVHTWFRQRFMHELCCNLFEN